MAARRIVRVLVALALAVAIPGAAAVPVSAAAPAEGPSLPCPSAAGWYSANYVVEATYYGYEATCYYSDTLDPAGARRIGSISVLWVDPTYGGSLEYTYGCDVAYPGGSWSRYAHVWGAVNPSWPSGATTAGLQDALDALIVAAERGAMGCGSVDPDVTSFTTTLTVYRTKASIRSRVSIHVGVTPSTAAANQPVYLYYRRSGYRWTRLTTQTLDDTGELLGTLGSTRRGTVYYRAFMPEVNGLAGDWSDVSFIRWK